MDTLTQLGYHVVKKTPPSFYEGSWLDIAHIQKQDITVEQFLADCKKAGITSTIDYEFNSMISHNECSCVAQLPWGKSAVRKELK